MRLSGRGTWSEFKSRAFVFLRFFPPFCHFGFRANIQARSDPTPEQVAAFSTQVPDGPPLVMINLLRFREWAAYPPARCAEKHTGREAYELYSRHAMKYLAEVGGRPIWRGEARHAVIARSAEQWDEAILSRASAHRPKRLRADERECRLPIRPEPRGRSRRFAADRDSDSATHRAHRPWLLVEA